MTSEKYNVRSHCSPGTETNRDLYAPAVIVNQSTTVTPGVKREDNT